MARKPEDARARGEALLKKAQKTDLEAKTQIELDLMAVRAKTARLRELRLAGEAAAGKTELDRKPAKAKAKPRAKKAASPRAKSKK